MKRILFFVILFTLLLTGCTNNKEYSIKAPSNRIISSLHNTYQNGIVYTDNNILCFLDYDSFRGVPLCNKPNCLHNDSSCIAQTAKVKGSTPSLVYRDNIYYFTSSSNIIEGRDGKSTNYNIECDLNKINLHTGYIEKVCSISDMEATTSSQIVYINGTMYFIANNGSIQTESGAWYYFSSGGKQHLCSINLDTNEFYDYGQINDNEKIASTLFSIGEAVFGINGQVIIDGFFDNQLFMHYYYADNSEIVYNNLDCSVNDEHSIFHIQNVIFDIKSKEFHNDSNSSNVICTNDNYCILWDSIQNKYIARTNNNEIILDSLKKCDIVEIYEDTVWCVKDSSYSCFYNIKKQELYDINEEYRRKDIQIITKKDDKYIIHYFDESSNKNTFENVSEHDLCGSPL